MIPFNRWDLRYFASITCVLAPLRQPGQEGFMAAKYSVPVLKVLDRSTPSKIETWNYSAYLYRSEAYIINTFVESNLVYLDSYFPAKDKYLKKIEELLKAKLRGSSRCLPVNYAILCRPLNMGEFGLWNLREKDLGLRAKAFINYSLLLPSPVGTPSVNFNIIWHEIGLLLGTM